MDSLEDVSINYIMYPCYYGVLVAATPVDYRYRFKGKFKTLRSLPSGQRIELSFFLGLQNYKPHHGEPELAKVGPRDFSKNHLS